MFSISFFFVDLLLSALKPSPFATVSSTGQNDVQVVARSHSLVLVEMMELWASGFNAWGQLDFKEVVEPYSRDLKKFKCILRDEHVEILRATLSAVLVETSTGLHTAGSLDDLINHCISKKNGLLTLAIAGNDRVVSLCDSWSPDSADCEKLDPADSNTSALKQYSSFDFYLAKKGEKLGSYRNIQQIVANTCTFTALSDGKVLTWGDGRYEACLGREISNTKPVNVPSIVEDLLDLPTGPIRRISSGGYVTAALTAGNDLYAWGGRPGQTNLLEYLTGEATPVDINGEDVLDVAVGTNHMIALTMTRKLFVVGDGSNGQLGLDVQELDTWKEITLPLEKNQRISGVHAGYKNSLVIVEEIT